MKFDSRCEIDNEMADADSKTFDTSFIVVHFKNAWKTDIDKGNNRYDKKCYYA